MGCNCGDNEYNITVNNNGNCEPTTPIYNITLANVGVNGYSPIVRFVNETLESFNIAVDNITGTETSPAVPKLSYVADQINDVYTTIAGLGSTYLTKDGSNATLPFSVGNLTLYSNGTTISGSVNASGYIATGEIRPRNSSGITIGYDNYDAPINIVTANKAYYNSNEIATLNDMPTVGNGTIAIMMNGAIRGSFKVNQSHNTILDLGSTSNYTAGNGIDITSNVISVDEDDLDFLKNTATGTFSLSIIGTSSDEPYVVNIGKNSDAMAGSVAIGYEAEANGYNCTAIGIGASCRGDDNIVIGDGAQAGDEGTNVSYSYQIGTGTNLTSNSLAVGYKDDSLVGHNYQLLDLTTGKVPNDRINLDTIPSSNSGNAITSGAMYTALGNKQNTLIAGSNINISGDTISATDTTYSNFTGSDSITAGSAGLVPAPSAGDENKFLKGDGTWDTVGGGGTTYTAGTGIVINDDTISTSSTVMTTNTSQTITGGAKTNMKLITPIIGDTGFGSLFTKNLDSTNTAFKITNTSGISNTRTDLVIDNVTVYDAANQIVPDDRISNNIARVSAIPTINNSTITFTQDGTTVGTITLNQSSNQTIAFTGGGGGTPSVIDGGNA